MSALGLPSAFWSVPIHDNSQHKFAFTFEETQLTWGKTLQRSTEQEHLLLLDELFTLLTEAVLKRNPKKLQLMKREMTFLGSVISERGCIPDPCRVEREWREVLRPAACASRMMSAVELAYDLCTRHLLAVHWAVQHFTHVAGFCKVVIHMIHMPIQLLLNGHVTGVHQKPGVSELADGNQRTDTAAKGEGGCLCGLTLFPAQGERGGLPRF
ncbi:hypothetical protein MHYP_G00112570 [Metynnis hypsauchen]